MSKWADTGLFPLKKSNLPEVLRKIEMGKFQGSIKKEVEFPGVFKKNSCRISVGLGFSFGLIPEKLQTGG